MGTFFFSAKKSVVPNRGSSTLPKAAALVLFKKSFLVIMKFLFI
jgi:hypothetical protein